LKRFNGSPPVCEAAFEEIQRLAAAPECSPQSPSRKRSDPRPISGGAFLFRLRNRLKTAQHRLDLFRRDDGLSNIEQGLMWACLIYAVVFGFLVLTRG
jgi:hypothetical protein